MWFIVKISFVKKISVLIPSSTILLILKNNTEKSQVREIKYNELKKRIFMKRSKGSTCWELLNQIRNLSFVVYDNDKLDHLHNELLKLVETLKYHASKDEKMILEKPNVVRNMSKSNNLRTSPKRKLKKSSLMGRVGILAERKRKATSTTVIDPKIKKTDIFEEQSCFDPNVLMTFSYKKLSKICQMLMTVLLIMMVKKIV